MSQEDMALLTEVQHLCTFSIVGLLIYHLCQIFGKRRTQSACPSLLMSHIVRPIAQISSSLVLYRVPRSGSFLSQWRRYRNRMDSGEILEYPPYSPDMSPCDYDLFARVNEPLRDLGTTQNMNLSML